TQFESNYEPVLSVVTESFKQLFQQADVVVEHSLLDGSEESGQTAEASFPKVGIRFASRGASEMDHRLVMEAGFANQLYAWMLGAELEENLTDEHLEGLNEGVTQIVGQVMSNWGSEENPLTIEDISVTLIQNEKDFSNEEWILPGAFAAYSISFGEVSFKLVHYLQMNEGAGARDVEEETGSDSVDELNEFSAAQDTDQELVDVASVSFDDFDSKDVQNGHSRNINMLMDVYLEVQVELGRKPMRIQDVLKLGKGAVIELDKNAGEPLEVFVNKRKLAEGEVVVVDDHFGIRITHLVSPKKRIESLG
ncbi:flagellar motor switch protein FliN, partial [Caldithrix abyssi]|nr:flagellar motor switch protein FliN [Caldithrix abyssi]